MRSQVSRRLRSNSVPLNSIAPAPDSQEYSHSLGNLAAKILYRSPLPSPNDLPVYILNSWGFPDAKTTDLNALLPYVFSQLPDDEELIGGQNYEIVFFAGGGGGHESTQIKKSRPGWGWFIQAYQLLTRATRKRLQKLYLVHEKNWIRLFIEAFATVVSPKFRKKIVHVSTLSGLALHMPIEDLLIPPTAYLSDRRKSPSIYVSHASGRRAFGVKQPLPISTDGSVRLPRVLREATSFVITDQNIKTEGLFRINARAQTVEILKEAYDRGQKFIVWREREEVVCSSHRREGTGDVSAEEIEQTEGFELNAAAALIKQWYKDLREPIFPQSSYQALEKFYGKPDISLDPAQLLAMLSMGDDWSAIGNKTSRQILTMHLLPLLSRVAEFSDQNQMIPDNLAVCFAPSLLCGPDPLEDLKMCNLIRRMLVAMITHWKNDLAPSLDTDFEKYKESLRMPAVVADREDPLEEETTKDITELENQTSGIILQDNEDSDEEMEGPPPPLPPRPLAPAAIDRKPLPIDSSIAESPPNTGRSDSFSPVDSSATNGISPLRRKPAPALSPLPRYSTIINDRPAVFQGMQYYNSVAPEEEDDDALRGGDEENDDDNRNHELPSYEERSSPMMHEEGSVAPTLPPRSLTNTATATEASSAEASIQRKPVPKTPGGEKS